MTQLDQSILAKVLRGKLAPQDPRGESVPELPARIRTRLSRIERANELRAVRP